jgi:hypothetical protein
MKISPRHDNGAIEVGDNADSDCECFKNRAGGARCVCLATGFAIKKICNEYTMTIQRIQRLP